MKLPYGPKAPSLIQTLHWIAEPVKYMETIAPRYPDIFVAGFVDFADKIVFVHHPQGIQEILTGDTKQFSAPGELNGILQPLVGDYSVLTLSGRSHRRSRQLLLPPFHGERMQAYGSLIRNLTEKVMAQFAPGETFLAITAMQNISLEVMLQAVFGFYEGDYAKDKLGDSSMELLSSRYKKIKQLIARLSDLFRFPLMASLLLLPSLQWDLGSWSPWGYFRTTVRQIDEILYAEIALRRQEPNLERTDILSLLISARDEAGNPMTDLELRDELISLLFAGHETTTSAMSWALYWIHKLPEVREKLLAELETIGDKADPTEIARLPYLSAFCNETLRINPVAVLTFPRRVEKPVKLMGFDLEPETMLAGCIYLLHQRQDLYPEPRQFRPERFLEKQFSPYEFMPFGAGARRCIGAAFAQYEMKLVLTSILSSYELELAEQKPERPQRRGVILAPGRGVKMVMKGQRRPHS